MPSIHSELNTFLERRSESIRAKDIDRLMSFYAADIVYFDIVPPLRYVGQAALRARFLDWFGRYESGIGQDIDELLISASGDLAVASMLIRSGGTLKNGAEVGFWVPPAASVRSMDGRSCMNTSRCLSISRAGVRSWTSCPECRAGRLFK